MPAFRPDRGVVRYLGVGSRGQRWQGQRDRVDKTNYDESRSSFS
jgi:hypothetical protein